MEMHQKWLHDTSSPLGGSKKKRIPNDDAFKVLKRFEWSFYNTGTNFRPQDGKTQRSSCFYSVFVD